MLSFYLIYSNIQYNTQHMFMHINILPFIIVTCSFCLLNTTRKHSSRMCTARLPTVNFTGHQMSLPVVGVSSSNQVWTGLQWWPPDVTSRRRGRSNAGDPMLMCRGCTVRSNALWVMVTWGTPCEQTDMTENITFQLLRWWMVKMQIHWTTGWIAYVCVRGKKYDFNGKMTGKGVNSF